MGLMGQWARTLIGQSFSFTTFFVFNNLMALIDIKLHVFNNMAN